jgi:hypothetical protein
LLDTPAPSLSTTNAEPEDDLWSNPPQESHPRAAEPIEEEVAEEETDQDQMEEEDWEEAELEEEVTEEDDLGHAEPAEVQGAFARAQEEPEGADALAETTDASPAFPYTPAPAGTTIAALPANTVWSQTAHQEALDRLTTLILTMPPNTILVDLRQHRPTPRAHRGGASSGPQKLGLSKELLRTLYGGRYWDRGSVIQTSRRLESTRPPRWRRVVVNPDDREGLGVLVTVLAQGFSLVVLDSETSYAESARAAVISELRQRVANLCEGSCS